MKLASGQPIVNMMYEFVLQFDYNGGDPLFSLWQDGLKVSNAIEIETHAATLIFRLESLNLPTGAVANYATNFQWLDQKLLPMDRPPNIAFVRDDDQRVTLLDSNPNTQEGEINLFHFLFSVVVSGVKDANGVPSARVYTSHDPVIINKKPPVLSKPG